MKPGAFGRKYLPTPASAVAPSCYHHAFMILPRQRIAAAPLLRHRARPPGPDLPRDVEGDHRVVARQTARTCDKESLSGRSSKYWPKSR
jgi:hypothetical protein